MVQRSEAPLAGKSSTCEAKKTLRNHRVFQAHNPSKKAEGYLKQTVALRVSRGLRVESHPLTLLCLFDYALLGF
jgi:hypothetical protein